VFKPGDGWAKLGGVSWVSCYERRIGSKVSGIVLQCKQVAEFCLDSFVDMTALEY
jgi:hypothetical protein